MDISYLLFLQDFRNSIDNALTPFFESVSYIAISYNIIIPVLLYWCLNKRFGLFAFAGYTAGLALNALVKLTACIYRPWIRDSRVLPAGDAIRTATGYSFPSGHTSRATGIYGACAWAFWQNKKTRFVSILLGLLIVLTGFSRNYLGVHTPQDVLVAFTLMTLVLLGMWKLFAFVEAHPEKENLFLLGGILFAFLGLCFINFKSYPMDYVDGKLIVDPKKMMIDGHGDIGIFVGFCIGRFIEKKWVRFETTGLNAKGIALFVLGLIPFFLMNKFLPLVLNSIFSKAWAQFTVQGLLIFYIILLWPIVIKLVTNKTKKSSN